MFASTRANYQMNRERMPTKAAVRDQTSINTAEHDGATSAKTAACSSFLLKVTGCIELGGSQNGVQRSGGRLEPSTKIKTCSMID